MKLSAVLRAVVLAVAALAALGPSRVAAFREIPYLLELFLKSGGWVLYTGQPFLIQSIFRFDLSSRPKGSPALTKQLHGHNSLFFHAKQQTSLRRESGGGNGVDLGFTGAGPADATPLCVDIQHRWAPCDERNALQLFTFDLATYTLQSVAKRGFCVHALDDGGVTLRPCSKSDADQRFMFNFLTFQWLKASPSEAPTDAPSLCLDDGGDGSAQPSTIRFAPCEAFGSPVRPVLSAGSIHYPSHLALSLSLSIFYRRSQSWSCLEATPSCPTCRRRERPRSSPCISRSACVSSTRSCASQTPDTASTVH
ncbi:hypothetical protein PINS_up004262 [Pythium insidiosum]|nr:hypothetical protein PINS_up004262 [Pythium insidiosum]